MTRLMLVTFAMLGWFFYVMSGGSEFEPRGTRAEAPPVVAAAEKPEPRSLVPSPATELVTKVALRPAKPSEPKPEPIPAADAVDTEALLAQIAAGLNSDLSSFDNTGGTFSLASLDENAAVQVLDTDTEPETAAPPCTRRAAERHPHRVRHPREHARRPRHDLSDHRQSADGSAGRSSERVRNRLAAPARVARATGWLDFLLVDPKKHKLT